MTHYQKLATMLFRVIGVIVLLLSALVLLAASIFSLPATNRFVILLTFAPYLIAGLIFSALGEWLAKFVCKGLD